MSQMPELQTEVTRYKQWARSYEPTYQEEWNYEYWDDFCSAAVSAIDRFKDGVIAMDTADDLLYAIARDHESEILRQWLLVVPLLLSSLAKQVVSSRERDAKWQIAVSVAEAQLHNAADLIRPFLSDDDEYVRRRSLMVFAPFAPSEAEAIAITNLSDEFEYTRIAALHVLHAVGSSQLEACLDRLESDPSEYVRHKVQSLRSTNREA